MAMNLLRWTLALALAGALASPALADRPSLLDLQAALDDLVDPPAPAAVGGLVFEPATPDEIRLDLVDLVLAADVPVTCSGGCTPGIPDFEPVRATVVQNALVAPLVADMLAGAIASDARVSIPSEPTAPVLRFEGVVLESVESDAVAGRVVLVFAYQAVRFELQGTFSQWSPTFNTGAGCTVPQGEQHLDLAGNDPSNLGASEIPSSHGLGLVAGPSPMPVVSLTRVPPNPCYLRGTGSLQQFGVSFERLWESNDQFPGTRQVSESIGLSNAFVDRWELHVESGALREEIQLRPQSGTLTTRDFSPADGKETASQSVGF